MIMPFHEPPRRSHRQPFREIVRLSIAAICAAGGLSVAGGAHGAESAAQQEAFVNRFIAAINSKDSGKIMALVDSRSLACLTGENAPLLSFTIDNWMKYPISPRYNAQFKDLGPEAPLLMDSFMPGRFDYPVRPTRAVQIQADVTASNGVIVIAEIGLEAGEWKIVLACPKEGTTAWMNKAREEKKAKDVEQAKLVDALIAGMSPDYRNELVSIAKGGHWIDAVHKIEKDRQVDLTIAVLAMKRLAPLE